MGAIAIILASFFAVHLHERSAVGMLTGTVRYASSGRPAGNATVVIDDGKCASTYSSGRYSLQSVHEGKRKITTSAVGWKCSKPKEIDVLRGKTSMADLVIDDRSQKSRRRILKIRRADSQPIVDGRLGRDEWQGVTCTEVLYLDQSAGKIAVPKTLVRTSYDDKCLYVAFDCTEPEMPNIVANCPRHDYVIPDTITKDDTVEVYIDPLRKQNGLDGTEYTYAFVVNSLEAPRTTMCDLRQNRFVAEDYSYNADGVKAASHRDSRNGHWYAELSIPFANIPGLHGCPKPGEAIGILFGRHRAVIHHGDGLSSSAILHATWNESWQWNDLVFVGR